ncbi:MAG: DUF885 domain-containing protein [Sphingomonadales bacterium]|nr:DUF885 domain-containing protein [Sphingomonadales bacterium]
MKPSKLCRAMVAPLIVIGLAACEQPTTDVADAPEAASALEVVEDITREMFQLSPQSAGQFSLSADYVGARYTHRLDDLSPEGFKAFRDYVTRSIDRLEALDRDALGTADRITVDVVLTGLRDHAGAFIAGHGTHNPLFGYTPYPVTQLTGPHIDIPNLLDGQHAIGNLADAEDYLARVKAIAAALDGVGAKVSEDAAMGVIPPRFAVGKVVAMLEAFADRAPEETPLYTNFVAKVAAADAISESDRARLTDAVEAAVGDAALPAYARLAALFASLEARAPEDAGIWAQPGGAALYEALVRIGGDTDLSADAIHRIGLDEVARLTGEMDAIFRAQGMAEGTVGERMAALASDPRFVFPNTDEGRRDLLALVSRQVAEITARLPQAFATLPPQKLAVRRIPEYAEATAPGGYYEPPSLDGSRPGTYWINLQDTATQPIYSLPSLTHHEGNPGHHFQIALTMAGGDIPFPRRVTFFNSYNEGWALYSELVAAELGIYENDPWGDLGRLQSELFRAVRLVVDTGIHKKRWSREEAIDYMFAVTGMPMLDVVIEIERYAVWPGQALGYKLGQLKILELRERARAELEDRFDIREFHDVVLLGGALPMSVLESRVDAWVAAKLAG